MTRKLYTTQFEIPDNMIDLGVGQPGSSILPVALMRQATEHRLSQGDSLMLGYGPEQGDGPFLEALAAFLSDSYGATVDPLSLMVTGGASQALDIICTFFTKPGDTIFVSEPTYFIAPQIFKDYGLNIVSIPIDDEGIIIDALVEKLAKHKPSFVYTIPVFQNPTGVTLSPVRRQQLVELSEQHDFYIVADEVYQLLNYGEKPPQPLATTFDSERIFSIGSFSKILAPGLRLGWLQAAPKLMDSLVEIQFIFSGGSVNQYTSHIICSALELGLQQEHLASLKKTYQARIDVLERTLNQTCGELVQFRRPAGGFFMWLELPPEIDAAELRSLAEAQNVSFQPGVNFSADQGMQNFMRLCFAYYESHQLEEGIQRLATVLHSQ